MKKTIIFASVALATLFAFSSCQKENLENNYSENNVRVITATFESNGTKTTLDDDNVTPLWSMDDKILILNASGCEPPITLTTDNILDDGRTITFTTNLTGTLYAVYPASATTMTRCDGDIEFTIPAIQDGKFGSANICVAKSSTEDGTNKDNLVFRNATAVLKITTAANVVGVDITAANNIAGAVTASFEDTALSLTTTSLDKSYVSAVGTSAPTDNVFYLAVAPGETGAATVNCYKTDKKGSTTKDGKILERNVIYSMDLFSIEPDNSDLTGQRGILNGHEYVIIKAKYDGTNDSYLKWATMNIGATAVKGPDSYGRYFMWGETKGIVPNGSEFTFPDSQYYSADNSTWDKNQCFVSNNCPWTNGIYYDIEGGKKVFTKYVPSAEASEFGKNDFSDDKTILDPEDDAASVNWGGTWRMPEGSVEQDDPGDFKALKEATYWEWNSEDGGFYVYVPQPGDKGKVNSGTGSYDKSTALLFFPAAGRGDEFNGVSLNDAGSKGYYWSKNLSQDFPASANHLELVEDYLVNPNAGDSRYFGLSIRPVSE